MLAPKAEQPGVIHRELARIRVLKYLTPLSKAVQSIYAQCDRREERECEAARPPRPPAIYHDEAATTWWRTRRDLLCTPGLDFVVPVLHPLGVMG